MEPKTASSAFQATIREQKLMLIYAKPMWDEEDLAILFDVTVDTIRDMKQRNEIYGVVRFNLRSWRVSRDAFLEMLKEKGLPQPKRGRPTGSGQQT